MDRALKVVAAGLGLAFLVVYLAAKVHFFERFAGDFDTYFAEHWPFWAGMALIGALLWPIGSAIDRRARAAEHDRAVHQRDDVDESTMARAARSRRADSRGPNEPV